MQHLNTQKKCFTLNLQTLKVSKDIKLSKKKTYEEKENDIHKNRIKLLSEYVELEKTNPEVFDNVNINFKNLLFAYQQPNPRDYFYLKVFGKTYSQKACRRRCC